jgi:hypothetical protein
MKRLFLTIRIVFIVLVLGAAFFAYLGYSSRSSRLSLRAEYSVEKADVGIPGISKMYDARIINRGALPV